MYPRRPPTPINHQNMSSIMHYQPTIIETFQYAMKNKLILNKNINRNRKLNEKELCFYYNNKIYSCQSRHLLLLLKNGEMIWLTKYILKII